MSDKDRRDILNKKETDQIVSQTQNYVLSQILKQVKKNNDIVNKEELVNHSRSFSKFNPFSIIAAQNLQSIQIRNDSKENIKVFCYDGSDILNIVSNNKQILRPNQTMKCYTRTDQSKIYANNEYHIGDSYNKYRFNSKGFFEEDY